jgi:CHAD domain-containing protein
MSDFRVRPGEPVAQELARVIASQLERAEARLAKSDEDSEAAFHEARRRIKRARAAARVARSIDKDLAKDINAAARDASRVLSEARDADVIAAAARAVAERTPDGTAAAALNRFARRAAEATPAGDDRAALAEEASKLLAPALKLTGKLENRDAPTKALKRAASRAVVRACEAFEAAHGRKHASDAPEEVRHEWRKRVKELAYVERLLGDVWPLERAPRPDLTRDLGKLLGEERDLLLLAGALKTGARACGGAAARNAALAVVQQERLSIVEKTTALGREVHEEAADA